jgi:acetyl-CoA decarbonylase/synthase complex subunit gamma
MALTGLAIYSKLPKSNCKECGVPTCLAFAMKVAAGQAGLDDCPRLTPEARAALEEAAAPPQRLVTISGSGSSLQIGQETVLFRHEQKFYHPTGIALTVSDALDPASWPQTCAAFKALWFTRVGEAIGPNLIALVNDSKSAEKMQAMARQISECGLGLPLVLISESVEPLLTTAQGPLSGTKPLLFCTSPLPVQDLVQLAKQTGAPICVAGDAKSVAERVEELGKQGVKDIVISPGRTTVRQALEFLTQSRRAALKKKFRSLGCPVLVLADGADPAANTLDACAYVCKYAGVVVTNVWDGSMLATILTTRQNIYTDPQKPVQVEPKLYAIGEVTPQSPLLVTTNFSLSYYSVEGQVEASRVPTYILSVDTEGTSVLTAWASDKFNAKTIAAALKACKADQMVTHHKVVIPGLVAVLSAAVADESGWNVLVGPKEASGIGPYLKSTWTAA